MKTALAADNDRPWQRGGSFDHAPLPVRMKAIHDAVQYYHEQHN